MSHDAGDTERSPLLRNGSGTASSFGSTDTLVLNTIKGDAFLVDWVGSDDLGNPQNLHPRRKWLITMALGLYALTTTFASSVFGTATVVMAKEFNLEPFEVEFGCTSLFMIGFAMGPTVWGPSSERFGRKSPLLVAYVAFIILQLPVALSANPSVIFATRLLQGFTGAAPSSILSGTLADIWSVKQRGVTMAVVGTALGIGPIFGPLVGAMLIEYHLGWRWIGVVTGIGSAFVALMTFPFIPETYAPILLCRRAQELRLLTKNWAYRSRFEEAANEGESFAKKYLLRPAQMLTLEPILLLMSLYISCSFGLLYNFFVAYPASFISERHWTPTLASLPLLLVLSGTIAGGTIMVYTADSRFAPNAAKGRPAEARLLLMMVGAVSLPLGIFGFAFCSDIDNAVPQMLFGIPTGLGIQLINMQALNYLVDVYGVYANSAVAANTTLRSLFAAGLPVVARRYLYPSLGVKWATCVLGLVAVSFAPIPVLFYFFGAKIRARSRWVPPV